ncbi:HNH endonuclease [Alkalicoccobacillus porphyridii]|uniref:HNH endonuclease n=1 Tax=Alkalicoccobacillus porphyridii TaxID=2597270 RepID=A0A553ZTC8_9BACI|nr:HNH endonuclease [Alkalicoccobacillus porphyridii]TSB44729.1 HNH endonuclease [Alkalicoccobacillus porphyridii]
MTKNTLGQCELCLREKVKRTVHHLLPKQKGGTNEQTALLCIPCHKQIHAQYSNTELAARLTSIKELQEDEAIRRFLKWIRKQPGQTIPRTRRSNEKL